MVLLQLYLVRSLYLVYWSQISLNRLINNTAPLVIGVTVLFLLLIIRFNMGSHERSEEIPQIYTASQIDSYRMCFRNVAGGLHMYGDCM